MRTLSARLIALAALSALALAACDDSSSDSNSSESSETNADTTGETIAAEGLPDFYAVPDPVPDDEPGTLINSEVVDAPDLDGTLYRVMYVSRSLQDEPIAVTGLVAVPNSAAPSGGYPVVAWAHGTTGIADECAPSLEAPEAASIANGLLDRGYLVAATDYEGLGTPGRHPYVVGESEARGVFDSIRAAQQLDDVEVSDRVLVWGHSQGGHAAMFTLDGADEYAPEFEMVGVVAGAPPSQLFAIYQALRESPFRHYLLMAAGGWNAAYGDEDAPLDEVLTPEGIDLVPVIDEGCAGDIANSTADVDTDDIIKADPNEVPEWNRLLRENDPGEFTTPADAPLLVIQGGNDEQIPVAATALMFDQLCAIGQDQTRWIYPGQSHAGVVAVSANDMLTWIDERFAGDPTSEEIVPTGQPDVEVMSCNLT
jgi:pimeloyl-ACP methyl ester carboxylesterase